MSLLPELQAVPPFSVHQSFVLRRNIRIKSHKLPSDFFNAPLTPYPTPTHIPFELTPRIINTPSFRCRSRCGKALKDTIEEQRKVQTARASIQKGPQGKSEKLRPEMQSRDLSLGRPHKSESFKERYSLSLENKNVRLPKILKKALINQGWAK